tara:strand:+ start:1331 stop:1459 length:129 start_codon:yes stop_codon:yes gene_type:complete
MRHRSITAADNESSTTADFHATGRHGSIYEPTWSPPEADDEQ